LNSLFRARGCRDHCSSCRHSGRAASTHVFPGSRVAIVEALRATPHPVRAANRWTGERRTWNSITSCLRSNLGHASPRSAAHFCRTLRNYFSSCMNYDVYPRGVMQFISAVKRGMEDYFGVVNLLRPSGTFALPVPKGVSPLAAD